MAAAQESRRGATKVQQYKVEAKDELKRTIEGSVDVLFADYRGLTVAQITELRRGVGERNSILRVVKNSHARRAFEELGVQGIEQFFVGPTVLAISSGDGGPVAKAMLEFARGAPLQLKGGWCGRRLLGPQEVEALSRLPGRAELLGVLMGTMKAPMSNLVYALGGVTQKLLRTLIAVRDKKEKEAA